MDNNGNNNDYIEENLIFNPYIANNNISKLNKKDKKQEAFELYDESIRKYKNKYYIYYQTVFDNPLNFQMKDNILYYNTLEINEKNVQFFFNLFNLRYNAFEDTLFFDLRTTLKLLKMPHTYWDYVFYYKMRSNTTECILDNPINFFNIIVNNLCYDDGSIAKALTYDIIKEIFGKYEGSKVPTYQECKKIFNSLKKLAMEGHKLKETIEINPYSINYSIYEKTNIVIKSGEDIVTSTHSPTPRNISIEYDSTGMFIDKVSQKESFYKWMNIYEDLEKLSPTFVPEKFSKLVYYLTNGEIDMVDKLSELVASILSEGNIDNRLTVIYVPKNKEYIADLMGSLACYKVSSMSLRQVCASKNIKNLINLKLEGTRLNISFDDSLPNGEGVKVFKKILNSKSVTARDSFLGQKTFLNNMHFVYITSSDEKIIQLENDYKINLIKLNFNCEDLKLLIGTFIEDQIELEWVYTNFAFHGLKRIAEKKLKSENKHLKKTKSKKLISNGIGDFINDCCERDSNSMSYADDIYKKYIEYFKVFYGGEPVKRVDFVKYLKGLGCHYYRPHRANHNNGYAFSQILFDANKFNKMVSENIQQCIYIKNKSVIEEHLKSMNNICNIADLFKKKEIVKAVAR